MSEIVWRYFRSVAGHVVPRFGTATHIGVRRDPKAGWIWDTSAVVRLPEAEVIRYLREYTRALRDGAIAECTQADYDAHETQLERAADATATVTTRAAKRGKGEES